VKQSDFLSIVGLQANAFHGVLDHERKTGQLFLIDVTVEFDAAAAAASDDLADTVDYATLAGEIVAAVERDPVNLIESIAERVASVVLAHSRVERATVTIHKPAAPIAVPFDDVAVSITRSRA
jgi:7,8-dihydroneopterin aldolase/epimerase/oxygenase